MKIVHISDWHRELVTPKLPDADLYVVTGDVLPNFPLVRIQTDEWLDGVCRGEVVTYDPYDLDPVRGSRRPKGLYAGRIIDPAREALRQTAWCLENPFRKRVGISADVPVLAVRGNHDFIDLHSWIGGCVWEVNDDPTRTIEMFGLKFGGCRGIPYIQGEWADEYHWEKFNEVARDLPEDIDVFISHCPPANIMDAAGAHYGSEAIANYITKRMYNKNLKAHLFGHVHNANGTKTIDNTLFSNAATTVNRLDL